MKLNNVVPNSCRVCLKRSTKLRSLYKPLDEGEEPPNEMLRLITGVELEEVDVCEGLPKFICKNCELSLSLAYQFRVKVLRTHQILQNLRVSDEARVETNDSTTTSVKVELDYWANGNAPSDEVYINEEQVQNSKDMKVEVLELSFSDIDAINIEDEEQEILALNEEDEEINEECKPEYLDDIEFDNDAETASMSAPETVSEAEEHDSQGDQSLFNYDMKVEPDDDAISEEATAEEKKLAPVNIKSENKCWDLRSACENAAQMGKRKSPTKSTTNNKGKQKQQPTKSVQEAEILGATAEKSSRSTIRNAAHICDICGNIYAKRGRMMEHRRRHDKELRFACELCDKRFHLREKLRKHMFLHTGGKPYKCSFCSRTFFYESVKKAHETVHSGVKPYVCDECNKAFAYAHALSKHKLIHADIKLYHCEYCGKDFRLQHHMKQHIETKLHQNAVRVAQMSHTEIKSLSIGPSKELPATISNI
ncbi:zinc finger protein 616 [Anastrepha ludens]|uniref:zinc finger protein 616 n=1 Tax=Anastrepha ludens TaxID=28586 RepID=UPI0023AFDED5|nr:zinc finger protein 616 [Anastrepha ludens]